MMIGERIQYLRNEACLTQEQLAKVLNVAKSTLASYEQNSRTPSIETIIILSNYFNVSADYILELTNRPTPLSEKAGESKHFVNIPTSLDNVEMAIDDFELIKEFIVYKYNKK